MANDLDTLEQIAYLRGKAAGYNVGLVDGWDACMRHVESALIAADKVIQNRAAAIKEPQAMATHRKAVLEAQRGQEEPK